MYELAKHPASEHELHADIDPHRRSASGLSDIILGGQDGLVNVLGVILGVAAATHDPRVILVAGLAATFAESVSMGAVAYTSTLADADYFDSEKERELRHIEQAPRLEREEVRQIYADKGFNGALLDQIVDTITTNPEVWVAVMMAEEHQLAPVDRKTAFRAAWIVTSTTETQDFNQENLNRGWTLYVSSDPSQTKRVLEFQKKAQTLDWKKAAPERDLRIRRLQNTNRLLKNYEVVIPFAELIEFPAATARARRDLSRFMQTVALCTLMHQYQREAKQEGELTYLEATLDDYRAAFEIMAPIIAGTLSDLSERSKRVLRVAVHLRDSTAGEDKSAADVDFGVRDLQAHADEMNLDLRNSQDLRRVLKVLTAQEYIIITEGAEQRGGGKAKRYALASSSLSLNEDGELVGLADALMGITTPEELRHAVEAAHV